MLRLTFLLRRKPELSLAAFQDYWLNQHAPLVASHSTHLNIARYVQTHTLNDATNEALAKARGDHMEPPYDGVADLWWPSMAALLAANATPEGQAAGAALLEDEAKFIDLPASPLWLSCEYPQVNPTPENIIAHPRSNIIKIYYPLRHQKSLSDTDARAWWLQQHGPVIRSHAPASGILRYIQVHRIEHPFEAALRESRGTNVEPYLGHAEVWVERGRGVTPESRAAAAAAVEDESRFIDFARSAIWIAKEHVIINRH